MRDTGHSTRARGGRLHAVDTAKGVGIVAVVFGHAWRGAYDAGILRDEGLFRVIDNMIYAWHMPLFFLLSGLLFLEVLPKAPPSTFLISRVRRLLWPFALWTWIFFGVKLLAGQAANRPVTIADFPLIPLPPYEHLWFLWALLLAQVVVLGLWLVLRHVMEPGRMRWLFGAGALALVLAIPLVSVPSQVFGAAVQHFPYFIAGIALGGVAHMRPPLWFAVLAGAAFAALAYATSGQPAALIVSLALTILACTVFSRLDANSSEAPPHIGVLRTLGNHSLAIFLAHTIFSAAFRIGLLSVGIDALWIHLVVATAVGLMAPILLVLVSRRFGVARLLGF